MSLKMTNNARLVRSLAGWEAVMILAAVLVTVCYTQHGEQEALSFEASD